MPRAKAGWISERGETDGAEMSGLNRKVGSPAPAAGNSKLGQNHGT
jgi:hypothetical protein